MLKRMENLSSNKKKPHSAALIWIRVEFSSFFIHFERERGRQPEYRINGKNVGDINVKNLLRGSEA